MTFGERITQLRKENGYPTRKSFCEKLKIPETTLRNYETDAREPGHTFLKQLSDIFNVSSDYLLGISSEKERISPHGLKASEYKHIEKYRALDDHGKQTVDIVLDRESKRVDSITEKENEIASLKEQISSIPTYLQVNAAHAIDGASAEDIQHDEDIMDDENF